MNDTVKTCFICGNTAFRVSTRHYARCMYCGHEELARVPSSENIINDRLDKLNLNRKKALDRFRNRVVRRCRHSKLFLVDIGSSSGRFLYQNSSEFIYTLGIEVTPECVLFSRALGLRIETNILSLRRPVSAVTFWHSLEHLSASLIKAMLGRIREYSLDNTVVIVSVPNADSLQYFLLKEDFTFYDFEQHLHQFTPQSVDMLLSNFGYEKVSYHFSFAYSMFGWLQGFLNIFNRRHNYLYYRRKRGHEFNLTSTWLRILDGYNIALVLFLLAPCLLLTFYDFLFMRKGGVLTICYQRKIRSKL